MPPWLEVPTEYVDEDLLAKLGDKANFEMLLKHETATRKALKQAFGAESYNLMKDSQLMLKHLLRIAGAGAVNKEEAMRQIFEEDDFKDVADMVKDRPIRLHYLLFSNGELLTSEAATTFLAAYPSPQKVRLVKKASELYAATKHLLPAAAAAVRALHAEGNPLRQEILRSGVVDGKVVDFLDSQPPKATEGQAVAAAVAKGLSPTDVRRFYQTRAAAHQREKNESSGLSKEKRAERRNQLEKLQGELVEMEDKLRTENKAERDAALKRVQELRTRVAPDEKWNQRKFEQTPQALLEELHKGVETSLNAVRDGDYDNVTELASSASSSVLRYALVTADNATKTPCKQASLSVFEEPLYLKAFSLAAKMKTTSKTVSTASQSAFDGFTNSVTTHGLDFAASAHFGGFGSFGVVAGRASTHHHHHEDHEKRSELHSERAKARVAQCDTIPMCSFEISMGALKFTEDALYQLSAIGNNTTKAKAFLAKYGDMVPCGLHTLGGVRLFVMNLEKNSSSASAFKADVVDKEWEHTVSAGGFFLFGGGAFSATTTGRDQTATSSGSASKKKDFRKTHETILIGPQAPNRGAFWEALRASNKSWQLINRDLSLEVLVPIWEVLERSPSAVAVTNLHTVIQTLRREWCHQADIYLRGLENRVGDVRGTDKQSEETRNKLSSRDRLLVQLYLRTTGEGGKPPPNNDIDRDAWVPDALAAVRDHVAFARSAAGDQAPSLVRAQLLDCFRSVAHRAPPAIRDNSALWPIFAFEEPQFCHFVEDILSGKLKAFDGRRVRFVCLCLFELGTALWTCCLWLVTSRLPTSASSLLLSCETGSLTSSLFFFLLLCHFFCFFVFLFLLSFHSARC